jgi:hypothetical protein
MNELNDYVRKYGETALPEISIHEIVISSFKGADRITMFYFMPDELAMRMSQLRVERVQS